MFGGRKERALEEELGKVNRLNGRKREMFLSIKGQKDNTAERFAQMTASSAQMERDIMQAKEQMQQMTELAEKSMEAAGEVHGAVVEINNAVGTFSANHSVFVGQMRQQKEKITEVVESNKHFTTPMKYISEVPASLREEAKEGMQRADRMKELSKNMSVLSLNAAIEAGRMGEVGEKFVSAAEEVRSFAEQYEKEATELAEQLSASEARVEELEEHVRHLNQLLKENNISMTKLLKDSMQHMGTYEGAQIDLREVISDTVVGQSDALQQSAREMSKIAEEMGLQLDGIGEERVEQKRCADELEGICENIQQSVEQGLTT